MASKIFRPRRGTEASLGSTTVLASGELFFEYPSGGVGTGKVKVKMGDGVTAYSDLPYAIDTDSVSDVTVSFSDLTDTSDYADMYYALESGATLSTLISNIKGLFMYLGSNIDTFFAEVYTEIYNVEDNIEAQSWGTF